MSADSSSPLRFMMEMHGALGYSLKDLTVLAVQNDPFRVDTPASHRDGQWLAGTAADLGLGDRTIHLRGLHYMVLGRTKPNGQPYANTDAEWSWLSGEAAKAARWLGYIPFGQIVDQRNAAPVIRLAERREPWPYISTGIQVEIPDIDDLTPEVNVADFVGVQPYHLVLFGEKSSLEGILGTVAANYGADLYLPTGEISDTQIHHMAKSAAEDGRPMVVFTFSDCDPAGWQMPISIARKLQAFKVALYPEIEFQVRRVGLLPEHVREYGLPSTPLKDSEKRRERWTEAMGVAQTEIDALASLRPDLLRTLASDALAAFYDFTLARRVDDAKRAWIEAAQNIVDASLDQDRLRQISADGVAKLAELREQIDAINDSLRVDTGSFDLPDIEIPQAATLNPPFDEPLIDSRWEFADQTTALIESKAYRGKGVMSR